MSCMPWVVVFLGFAADSSEDNLRPTEAIYRKDVDDVLWTGMRDQRLQLRSGIYRATGRKIDDDPQWGRLEGELEFYGAFDFDRGLFRFDRVEPVMSFTGPQKSLEQDAPSAPAGRRNWTKNTVSTRYVETPEKRIYWSGKPAAVVLGPQDTLPPEVRPFDVRALGLGYWMDWTKRHSFDELHRALAERFASGERRRESDRLVRFRHRRGKTATTLWIDTEQGFAPIRMETRESPSAEADGEMLFSSEVTWQLLSDVWVPATFRIEERHLAPRVMSYEIAFDWESVNEAISPEVFDVQGMDLADGTFVVDRQLGKSIVTERVGKPKQTVDLNNLRPRPTIIWLVAANLVAVIAVLGWAAARLRLRRHRE